MSNRDINQVRNILANELGLTRDVVREIAREFVEATVCSEVKRMIETGVIDHYVRQEIDAICRDRRWTGDSMRSIVAMQAKVQVAEFIRENLKFSTTDDKQEPANGATDSVH